MPQIKDAELHNIAICQEIGSIAECNGYYTLGLTNRIKESGKSIESLTIGELIGIKRKYDRAFNQAHK